MFDQEMKPSGVGGGFQRERERHTMRIAMVEAKSKADVDPTVDMGSIHTYTH